MVQYNYDAWGNHKVVDANGNEITDSTHIGNLNPFRYRSYYFDVETGLYYLQTRYYDPEGGRFISQDSIEYANPEVLNGINLYAYCSNNPVMGSDPNGNFWLIALFSVVVSVAVEFISDVADDGKINSKPTDYIGAAVSGFVGALGGGLVSSIVFSGVGDVLGGIISGDIHNLVDVAGTFAMSAVLGGFGYGFGSGFRSQFANSKFAKIVNGATDNSVINKSLKIAGYGQFKIGRDGAEAIIRQIMNEKIAKRLFEIGGLAFSFVSGIVTNLVYLRK